VTERAAREVGEETGWLLIEKTTDEDENDSAVSVKTWTCWDLANSSLEELVQWTHLCVPLNGFNGSIGSTGSAGIDRQNHRYEAGE
jgi:hypothetical protein